jgi:hypothetical protein
VLEQYALSHAALANNGGNPPTVNAEIDTIQNPVRAELFYRIF